MRRAFLSLKRRRDRQGDAARKAALAAGTRMSCAVCGYFSAAHPPYGLLEMHHIFPHAAGGSGDSGNLILLCPTHHAHADRLSRANPNHTKQSLLAALGSAGKNFLQVPLTISSKKC